MHLRESGWPATVSLPSDRDDQGPRQLVATASSTDTKAQDDDALVALLSRTADGDRVAFAELYRLTAGALFAVLKRMLSSNEAAEDVLQDVYVSVWLKAGEYSEQRGRALTWLKSIARYRAIDALRRLGRERPFGDHELESIAAAYALPTGDERKLHHCIDELSADQRNSVQLAYAGGFTQQEIAASLAMPLGTVKSWIRRALGALKRCMDR